MAETRAFFFFVFVFVSFLRCRSGGFVEKHSLRLTYNMSPPTPFSVFCRKDQGGRRVIGLVIGLLIYGFVLSQDFLPSLSGSGMGFFLGR